MSRTQNNVHGLNGVFVGGEWVCDIEAIDAQFSCKDRVTSTDKHRARATRTPRAAGGVYDVVIIGAGCIGCAVARELAKTGARVVVVEAGDDVTQGATKANSGVIHSGCAARSGSVRARFAHAGCMMFPALDRELRFGFNRCGSLFLAAGAEEEQLLEDLKARGHRNGVEHLDLIKGNAAVRALEPSVGPSITAALSAPDAGVVAPYEYCIALAENAADNGVEFRLRSEVTHVAPPPPGVRAGSDEALAAVDVVAWEPHTAAQRASGVSSSYHFSGSRGTVYTGTARPTQTLRARYVVNCAGYHSGDIANQVDAGVGLDIAPRHGDYLLLHKNQHRHATRVLFPCPHPVKGKGVLVNPTLWGNLLIGPTARDIPADTHEKGKDIPTMDESQRIVASLTAAAKRLVPDINTNAVIHSFAGIRAKPVGAHSDWTIGPSPNAPTVINVAGIDSPGLTSSPAIAVEVVRILRGSTAFAGAPMPCFAAANPDGFVAERRPLVAPKADRTRYPAAKQRVHVDGRPLDFSRTSSNPNERIVCLCEGVTEAEVVETLRRSIPVTSTQGVRRRCRAGMGPCQGRRCERVVADIIARETGMPVEDVGRRGFPASALACVTTARTGPKL